MIRMHKWERWIRVRLAQGCQLDSLTDKTPIGSLRVKLQVQVQGRKFHRSHPRRETGIQPLLGIQEGRGCTGCPSWLCSVSLCSDPTRPI